MQLLIVGLLLVYIITLYFKRNPLRHSSRFMWVRFQSWFPLGMSYAFLYMARYNLDQLARVDVITIAEKSRISGWGFIVYAASLFFSGPLIDRVGGKKGMIIGCLGSAIANFAMGWMLKMHLVGGTQVNLVLWLSVFYVGNMFFQSFGAISTIKVKSFWFHVRERGTFGAIFGTLISLGVYFAFDWTAAIANAVDIRHAGEPGAFRALVTTAFGLQGATVSAFWYVFYIPAGILVFWALLNMILIKDTPDDAGFGQYETHDASAGNAKGFDSWWVTIRAVLTNKVLLMIGLIEFCSGILRDGTMKWYQLYVKNTGNIVPNIDHNWGLYSAVTGIVGAFLAGWVSDRFFHSRRAPVAAAGQAMMVIAVIIMLFSLGEGGASGMGTGALIIMLASIAVHSILSGTATADFGGRRGAATATGIADGFSKIGTSFQEFALGVLVVQSQPDTWKYWPMLLLPFTVIGLFVAIKLWNVLPAATRKYLEDVEKVVVRT